MTALLEIFCAVTRVKASVCFTVLKLLEHQERLTYCVLCEKKYECGFRADFVCLCCIVFFIWFIVHPVRP